MKEFFPLSAGNIEVRTNTVMDDIKKMAERYGL